MLESAWQISRDDHSLALLNGQLEASRGEFVAAERSFHSALKIYESDAAWYQLVLLCANQARYPEAIYGFQKALQLDAQPDFRIELSLAKAEVLNREENTAFQTLEDALRALPDSGPSGAAARADVYDVKAAAYSQLSNWPAAIAAEERAVQETPTVVHRWETLAAMYVATGKHEQALHAQETIDSLMKRFPNAGRP